MSNINLPLFYYPTTWLIVDDDKNLLNAIEMTLSNINSVKAFQAPTDCLSYLEKYTAPSTSYSFLKSMTDDENYGALNHLPIDFDVTCLAKLAENKQRHQEVSAISIDYNMPEIDGIALAERLRNFPAKKILLTGETNTDQAINAFNNNLIQAYLQKFDDNMGEKLVSYLKRLTFTYFQSLTEPLLAYLETDKKLPHSDPVFIDFFKSYCEVNNITEYYLIDRQGSMLLKTKQGLSSCFVVQSEKKLDSWLSFYSSENDIDETIVSAIKNKHKIPFLGIEKDLWQCTEIDWETQLFASHVLDGREKYFWTVVDLT